MNNHKWIDGEPVPCELSEKMPKHFRQTTLDPICREDKDVLDSQIERFKSNIRDDKRRLRYYLKVQAKSKRLYKDYAAVKALAAMDDDTLFYAMRCGLIVVKPHAHSRLECLAKSGNLSTDNMV